MSQWDSECRKWRKRVLTGRYAHWCDDWDGLPVDETTFEWPCACYRGVPGIPIAIDFISVTECIMRYEKPCGCAPRHSNDISDGCLYYEVHDNSPDWDLIECRHCGAVWTNVDARADNDAAIEMLLGGQSLASVVAEAGKDDGTVEIAGPPMTERKRAQ